ncbi:MAG: 23S rRNA (adenine(2503)-C(2))-methyltransferase RlmN [Spirochaetes bacterium]|nr:23S rRNA (adenine(2503)-C(2))-methyltransferase RlmN [Spirochaetota bacterium]
MSGMSARLTGMLPPDIVSACGFDRPFRGLQVFRWIARGAKDFASMSDLPALERERLGADFGGLYGTSTEAGLESADGTVKLRVRCADGAVVECVRLLNAGGRMTACLSSQVGCPMACVFCRTGTLGFRRNLEADEMVEQVLHLAASRGRPSNIVFMGMGEPLLNLRAVRAAIAVLTHPEGLGYSPRKITLSTCGLAPAIRELADSGPHVRLAVSLTVADDELRSEIMPVNRSHGLAELKDALLHYQSVTGDRITLETALMKGVNVSSADARKLAEWIAPLKVQVNLIPWNPVEGIRFQEPSRQEVEAFERELEVLGVPVTRRTRRGRGVSGACGQLGETLQR